MYAELRTGGAQAAITTAQVVVDLTPLAHQFVQIWCDEADILFSASDVPAGGTLVASGTPQAASATALVADRVAQGVKAVRRIGKFSYLVVKTATGSGTLNVKALGYAPLGVLD